MKKYLAPLLVECFPAPSSARPPREQFSLRSTPGSSSSALRNQHYRLPALTLALFAGMFASSVPAKDPADSLVERLERLERRLGQVEQENLKLKNALKFRTERLERVEARAGKNAIPGVVPTYSSVNGDASFKIRGVIDADAVAFHEHEGNYDYNSGTGFRRARIGLEGDAFMGQFKWRLEADLAGNAVGITDGFVAYVAKRPWTFSFGQHKAHFGLESNTVDNYNTFLERSMYSNAFGGAGAERRFGLSALYGTDQLTAGFGMFGDAESASRVAAAPDESIGVNGRVTWAPLFEPEHILQLGLAGYVRDDLKEGGFADAVRLSDRPNVRIDGGNFADTGIIRQVESLQYLGAETVYIRGPLTLAGEYGKARAVRKSGLKDVNLDGFYVYGAWFLTGESRGLKTGNFERIKPWREFDLGRGNWGAFELALRYDRFDFSETPVAANHGNHGDSLTAAFNWYLNGNLKLMLNWVHFQGERSPLDPVGSQTSADALAARVHLDW